MKNHAIWLTAFMILTQLHFSEATPVLGYTDKESFTILGGTDINSTSIAGLSEDDIDVIREHDIPISEEEIIAKIEELNALGLCPKNITNLKTASLCAWNASARMNEYGFLAAGRGGDYALIYMYDKYPKLADKYADSNEIKRINWFSKRLTAPIEVIYDTYNRRLEADEVDHLITYIEKEQNRILEDREIARLEQEYEEKIEAEKLEEMKQTNEIMQEKDKTLWQGIKETYENLINKILN